MSRFPLSNFSLPSQRLRVGDCTVDMPLREISAPGARRPRRVTPKAIAVLATLVEHGGRVVSRDTLLSRVWPGTLPTDDVVTQAITQLRKAFDDERGNPRYIETIAKYGYRLLADVEWLDEATGAVAPGMPADADADAAASVAPPRVPVPPAPVTVRGDWRAIATAIAVAGGLVALLLAWSLRNDREQRPAPPPQARSTSATSYRLITSAPGIESTPSLSPDAALVAYVAVPTGQRNTAVMVQTTDPSTPRQLTRPENGADDSAPAWSPDGREIAFLRVTPGAECRILVVAANGGAERSVGACDPRNPPGFDWTHDGQGLVFGSRGTPAAGPGLKVLHLASGAWRALDYGAVAGDLDFAPRYSPDGRWIVFVRNSPVGDLWRIPSIGGPAQRLTRLHADVRGWDWTPDGRGIVLSRWSGSESRMLRLDLTSGVVQDLGIDDGVEPSMAAKVPALAFTNARNYFGIHRVGLGRASGVERLYPSSGRDRLPALAPDGDQIVFTSDRAGDFGLWWGDVDRPESLRLIEGLRPESWNQPDWSRDSRRLLVVGEGSAGFGLYEVTPASDRVVRLEGPEADIVQALYAPDDDRRLLVVSGADQGRLHLHLYDRTQQPWRSLASLEDVAVARVDHAGRRLLFTRPGQSGLWQADLQLSPGSVARVDPTVPLVSRYRAWAVADDGRIYVLERTPECATALRRLDEAKPLRCIDQSRRSGVHGFSLSPRGDAMYVTISLWDGGDIGFMPFDVAPETVGPG